MNFSIFERNEVYITNSGIYQNFRYFDENTLDEITMLNKYITWKYDFFIPLDIILIVMIC